MISSVILFILIAILSIWELVNTEITSKALRTFAVIIFGCIVIRKFIEDKDTERLS